MDKIRALVINDLNRTEQCIKNLIKSDNEIMQSSSEFIQNKSKRIRSIICMLYLKAHNIEINDDIIKLTVGTELIHNASLLHDDVVDSSRLRRGEPTIFDKYGSKVSVLCGDYLLSEAVKNLLSINNTQILNIFLDATQKMSEAEINQFQNRNNGNISFEQCIDIIKGKTAALFSACLKSSALLFNIDINAATKFGELFGIIFQINNDLQPDSLENDKKNGVNTIINILGIEKTLDLKDNYKKELSKILINVPINKYKQGIEDLIELL